MSGEAMFLLIVGIFFTVISISFTVYNITESNNSLRKTAEQICAEQRVHNQTQFCMSYVKVK
jgi:hypothetical protein